MKTQPSYTRFEYSDLRVEGPDISFTLRNLGRLDGAEVVQLYLGPAEGAPIPMALKSLAGYQRIELGAGRSRGITLHVNSRALEYWSVERRGWVLAEGERHLYVGSSSRDIRLEGKTRPAGSVVPKH